MARGRLETALSRLADVECRGETASERDLAAVDALRSEIASLGRVIEEREGQVAAVTEDYARDRDRLAQLQDVVVLRTSFSRDRALRDNKWRILGLDAIRLLTCWHLDTNRAGCNRPLVFPAIGW